MLIFSSKGQRSSSSDVKISRKWRQSRVPVGSQTRVLSASPTTQ